jgi:hypothetical protein
MVVLIWSGLEFHLRTAFVTVQEDSIQNLSNLSRAFEEHLIRTLNAADHTLQIARNAYEREPETFDLGRWSQAEHALEGPTFQIVIIGPNGFMKASTDTHQSTPLDLSDREHFRIHVDETEDRLFVSKPLIGRVTGRATIQLSRRVATRTGGFGGVILISVDPSNFTKFYDAIDIGRDGIIRVVGTDGTIRAVGRQKGNDIDYLGKAWSAAHCSRAPS